MLAVFACSKAIQARSVPRQHKMHYDLQKYKNVSTMSRLMWALLIIAILHGASGQKTEECPVLPECCEEDCCGKGTRWNFNKDCCEVDPNSAGFNWTYSPDYVWGCVPRVCCQDSCCGENTRYNTDIAGCIPDPSPAPPNRFTMYSFVSELYKGETVELRYTTSIGVGCSPSGFVNKMDEGSVRREVINADWINLSSFTFASSTPSFYVDFYWRTVDAIPSKLNYAYEREIRFECKKVKNEWAVVWDERLTGYDSFKPENEQVDYPMVALPGTPPSPCNYTSVSVWEC